MSIPERGAPRRAAGISLIELILFIVVVSIAVVGVLAVLNITAQKSADPLVRKQLLAIAESLLEEVQLMPFTYCDPDDPAVTTATSPAGCAIAEAPGPEAGESRYSTTTPFDNVNDYNGFSMSPILDLQGTPLTGLAGYSAFVQVTDGGLGLAAGQALLVTVTATGRGETVTLSGYRTRYAPNSPP
jgi:MSHA pilin protein MshD